MKMNYSKPILSLLFLLLFSFIGNAQEAERIINKSYPLASNGNLSLSNSYGNMTLNHWDKDEVKIQITVTVEGGSQERAEELLENITFDFEASPSSVSAKTRLPDQTGSWWKNWSFFGSKSIDYSIDYVVQHPKSVNVNLSNSYGSIFIDELDGKANIRCSYGKLAAEHLNHEGNEIDLQYSPGSTIEYLKSGTIEVDYSGITIENAETISLDADYSKCSFKRVNDLDFEADYGSLSVDEISVLSGDADYLSIKVGSLSKALDVSMDYGGLKVENIQASTEKIDINSDYSGISLGADADWAFNFVIETEYAGFKTDFPLNYRKKIIESTDRYYEGNHKNGSNSLKISADYGAVKLNQN